LPARLLCSFIHKSNSKRRYAELSYTARAFLRRKGVCFFSSQVNSTVSTGELFFNLRRHRANKVRLPFNDSAISTA
jgi:hypothetical protein